MISIPIVPIISSGVLEMDLVNLHVYRAGALRVLGGGILGDVSFM